MLFQWTKKDDFVVKDLSGTSECFPTELSLIKEEKRLIKWQCSICKKIIWKTRVIFSHFFFHKSFPLLEARDLKIGV